MTSHHMVYYVTAVMYLFIVKEKEKEKKNQKKKNIKLRKIDNKNKNISAQAHHNIYINKLSGKVELRITKA